MSIIGIDLGGTDIKTPVFDQSGRLQDQLTRPTDDTAHFAETIRDIARAWPDARVGLSAALGEWAGSYGAVWNP